MTSSNQNHYGYNLKQSEIDQFLGNYSQENNV